MDNYSLQKLPLIKYAWLRVVIFVALYQLVSLFLAFPVIWLLLQSEGASFPSEANHIQSFFEAHMMEIQFFVTPLTLIGSLLTILFCRKIFDRRSMLSLGFQIRGYFGHFFWGLLVGIMAISVGFFVLKSLGHITVESVSINPLQLFGYASFFFVVALHEEFVVRGYVMKNLMEGYGNKWLALIVSSIIFSAMHMFNPGLSFIPFLNLFLAGGLLGIYYMHRQNLWFPVALHFTWNFFQGPIYGFKVSGLPSDGAVIQNMSGPDWLTGGAFGFEGSAVCSVIMLLATFALHQYLKKSSVSISS